MSLPRFIRRYRKGEYIFQKRLGNKRYTCTSRDIKKVIEKRNEILGYDPDNEDKDHPKPLLVEQENERFSPDELWDRAFVVQDRVKAQLPPEWRPVIIPDDKPIGLAWLSDGHFGSPHTDYRAIKADAELINKTPGLYAVDAGDGRDNWIATKLQFLQRRQEMTFDSEIELYMDWLRILGEKLLVVVSGNHDLHTHHLAGIDLDAMLLSKHKLYYHRNEVRFQLVLNNAKWNVKVRHRWPGSSIFNPTHGIEVGWERGQNDFDIGVGGHTHIATLLREFTRENRIRYAILLGTYKRLGDPYHYEIGKPQALHNGCGMTVHTPDGNIIWFNNLQLGVDYLNWLRRK